MAGWCDASIHIELGPGAHLQEELAARHDFCPHKLWNHLSRPCGRITKEVHLLLLQPVI
jgi:hypothetical protein